MRRLSSGGTILLGASVLVSLGILSAGVLLQRAAVAGAIPPPLPAPTPNGFNRYVAASLAIVPARPPVDAEDDDQILTPAQAAINYAPARRRAWIASNAGVWKLLASAKSVPCRHPSVRSVLTPSRSSAPLRELARCQSIRVKDWKSQGRWNAAMDGGLDTLQMGRDLERGAPLLGSMVSISIESIGGRSLEDVPAHLNAGEAKAAARRLETLIGHAQPFSEVIREEKWSFVTMVDPMLGAGGSGGNVVATAFAGRSRNNCLQTMDAFIAQANKPKLSQKPVAQSSSRYMILDPYGSLFPHLQDSFFPNQRREAMERLLLLRLALRAFRVQNGAYPAQLSALSPTILKTVPVDPFGAGETLRYRVSGDSYVAWSIGPDGVDNSGTSIPIRPGKKREVVAKDSLGDIVVRP